MKSAKMLQLAAVILTACLFGCGPTGHVEDAERSNALPAAILFPENNRVPAGFLSAMARRLFTGPNLPCSLCNCNQATTH
jgi:hypothetical protein